MEQMYDQLSCKHSRDEQGSRSILPLSVRLVSFLGLLSLLGGCASGSGLGRGETVPVSGKEFRDRSDQILALWSRRHIRSELESFIRKLEDLTRVVPERTPASQIVNSHSSNSHSPNSQGPKSKKSQFKRSRSGAGRTDSKRKTSSKQKRFSKEEQYNESAGDFSYRHLSQWLARAYFLLAEAHYQDPDAKKRYWQTGAAWAEKALNTNPKFAQVAKRGGDTVRALKHLEAEDVPGMYWYLANVGSWARTAGVSTQLKYKNLIRSMVKRIIKLDENYFHGAIYRFWGAFYAVAPNYAGGDLDKSYNYFMKSMNMSSEYLGTRVLLAETYAVGMNDKDLFKRTLKNVTRVKLNPQSDVYSENFLHQRKARRLLNRTAEFF